MSRPEFERQLTLLSTETSAMATHVDDLIERALSSTTTNDPFDARIALNQERHINQAAEALEERVMSLLALQQPVLATDLRMIVGSLVVGQRLHRAGHGAMGIARLAIDLSGLHGTEAPPAALLTLGQEAREMLHDAVTAFTQRNHAAALAVAARDDTVDAGYRALRDEILAALSGSGFQEVPDENYHRRLTFWLWIAHKIERVADHSVVIARRAAQLI